MADITRIKIGTATYTIEDAVFRPKADQAFKYVNRVTYLGRGQKTLNTNEWYSSYCVQFSSTLLTEGLSLFGLVHSKTNLANTTTGVYPALDLGFMFGNSDSSTIWDSSNSNIYGYYRTLRYPAIYNAGTFFLTATTGFWLGGAASTTSEASTTAQNNGYTAMVAQAITNKCYNVNPNGYVYFFSNYDLTIVDSTASSSGSVSYSSS